MVGECSRICITSTTEGCKEHMPEDHFSVHNDEAGVEKDRCSSFSKQTNWGICVRRGGDLRRARSRKEGRKEYRIILQKLKVPEEFSSDPCEKERVEK